MKILFYISRFPGWGGIETVTEIIGNALLKVGCSVAILTHQQQERSSTLQQNVKIFVMPDEKKWESDLNKCYAIDVVKNVNPDVIIYQDCYANNEDVLFSMKSAAPKAKIVVCEHNTPLYKKQTLKASKKVSFIHEVYRRIYSWPRQLRSVRRRHIQLLQQCDRYVLLSKEFIPELLTVCNINASHPLASKVCFINNPVNNQNSSIVNWEEKENIILFVGQINNQKRVDIMLDIWEKHIIESYPNWKFLIIGDGPEKKYIEKLIDNRNIKGVQLKGYAEPTEYYRKAKLFWMTSIYEGWGMTLLEAMALGCVPIVMNTFSSIHDIIINKINGCLIPEGDLKGFAQTTESLMVNHYQYRQCALEAINSVQYFSIDRIIKDWLNLIEGLNVNN